MTIEQVSNLNSDIEQLRAQTRQAEAIFKKIDEVTRLAHKKGKAPLCRLEMRTNLRYNVIQ